MRLPDVAAGKAAGAKAAVVWWGDGSSGAKLELGGAKYDGARILAIPPKFTLQAEESTR